METRKHMTKKTTTKPKDTTPKHVKNTQTGVEPRALFQFRWYHIVSLATVLCLVVAALVIMCSRVDPVTLINSKYTLKYDLGCTMSISGPINRSNNDYRYMGASEGMMLGRNGVTDNLEEAYLKIIKLSEGHAKIEMRSYPDFEWKEQEIQFGKEYIITTEMAPDCMPGITYEIN